MDGVKIEPISRQGAFNRTRIPETRLTAQQNGLEKR
jgi:hypothetical protein